VTLATICSNALKEIGGFEVPASFFGNSNLTARQCVALSNRGGRTLERELRWTELIDTHTFTTTASTANYALPDDFRAFANMSQWDRTNQLAMVGPTSAGIWQWLQSGVGSDGASISRWWRIQGGQMHVYPTPTATGDTLVFDYYSKNWINDTSLGVPGPEWTADNDTPRIDEDLLTLDLKWRFLQARGMPYEPEYREFEAMKSEVITDNGGKSTINLGRAFPQLSNLPDTNFGS
jgi:hypothetical protein